jgi:hypothetical protein
MESIIININFSEMNNWDIESIIEKSIATQLDEKKCTINLVTVNNLHRETIEFEGKCSGVKLMGFITAQDSFIDPEEMEMNYELDYFLL